MCVVWIFFYEKCSDYNRHHINSSQQCRNKQTCNSHISQWNLTVYRSLCQFPFADKSCKTRHTHQSQRRNRKGSKHNRHFSSHTVHFVHMTFFCLMHKCTRTEERTNLHKSMKYKMCQCADQSKRAHHRSTKNNIRQVTNGRIRQPSLDMCFFQCPAAPIHNGKHGKRHHSVLCPCATQEIHTKTVISQTHDCKCTGIYDSNCMKQCGYRSRRYTSLWKPGRKRPDCRFHTKSHKGDEINPQKQWSLISNFDHIHNAAQFKLTGCSVYNDKYHTHNGERRTTEGIIQIFSAGKNRFSFECMHNQRNCYQCQ